MKTLPLVHSLLLAGMLGPWAAQAQTAPPAPAKPGQLERVTVTGSSIKRLANERALPLEVLTADEIRMQGIQTAEELLATLSANAANVDNATSRNNVFGAEQDRLTGGSSFANLRGLGPTGTLVLLNGRRVSTHGMSGGAVDLNTIPMALVERVEILKDGASALYGTDAIGGVINYILKQDVQGLRGSVNATTPFDSGGGQTRRLSLAGGYGALATHGFNVMASLTLDRNDILRGIERPWATGFQPAMGLSPDTTSAPHANIIGAAGTALTTAGSTVGPADPVKYTNLNLLAMQQRCDQLPFSVPLSPNIALWDKFGYTKASATFRCATDYGRQFMLRSPADNRNLMLRGTLALGDSATAFVEYLNSHNTSLAEFTPYQFSTTSNALTHYPVNGPHYLNLKAFGANDFDPTKPIAYRLRMADWGYRTLENVSDNQRLAAGIDGSWGVFDYRIGLSRGQAEGSSYMHDGYADTAKLVTLLQSGLYNPFLMPGQTQSAAALAAIEGTKVRGRLFGGKTGVTQFDGMVSGPLFKLPGGEAAFALGFDVRRESYGFSGLQTYNCVSTFTPANLALTNSVMGCPGNAASPDQSRDIRAVYGELVAPVFKSLELQLQLRHDRYSQIGNTTNPKLAFRFTPTQQILLRGSANTGFRAPTPQQLNLGSVELALTGVFSDPERCAVDPTQCQRNSLPYRTGGNPSLKPEKSTQATLGLVVEPMASLLVSADYWQIKLKDRIRSLSPTFMITNYALFRNSFIRDAAGNVSYIQAGWVNAAESVTKGIDLTLQHSAALAGGKLTSTVSATRMLSHKERLIETAPLDEYVGKWSNTTLYLPWKVTTTVNFKSGPWSATASMNFKSAYDDEDRAAYTSQGPTQRKVASYTTLNLFATYSGLKNLTLSAGVVNAFDRQPPFTWHNVDNVVGAGWDPRVADPRGRVLSVSATYQFF